MTTTHGIRRRKHCEVNNSRCCCWHYFCLHYHIGYGFFHTESQIDQGTHCSDHWGSLGRLNSYWLCTKDQPQSSLEGPVKGNFPKPDTGPFFPSDTDIQPKINQGSDTWHSTSARHWQSHHVPKSTPDIMQYSTQDIMQYFESTADTHSPFMGPTRVDHSKLSKVVYKSQRLLTSSDQRHLKQVVYRKSIICLRLRLKQTPTLEGE